MKFRKLRIAWSVFWGVACILLVIPRIASGRFGGLICVVPNRAIVMYENQLYVLEPGTRIITEYLPANRDAKIAGRFPNTVRAIDALFGNETKTSGHTVYVVAISPVDQKPVFLEPTKDNRIGLMKVKPEDHVHWRDKLIGGPSAKPHDPADESATYILEYVADQSARNRFVTFSSEKTIIKDFDGRPMVLHPMMLGAEKDAARFQTISFSGK